MAHFCFPSDRTPATSVSIRLPGSVQIGLWGGGPAGEALDIVVLGPPIVNIKMPDAWKAFPVPNLRLFEVIGVSAGRTLLGAALPLTCGSYAAPLSITVGMGADDDLNAAGRVNFYHGTSLAKAKELMTQDLVPYAVPEALLLDVNEYTDFGKGFYTHPEDSKQKAVEWAKRRNAEWGVVRFPLNSSDLDNITQSPLHFPDKFKTRPSNAPKLFDSKPARWIEFVEFNRHIRRLSITRPKDNDWTADYKWIRGPIWGRKDSGLPGAPGLPERYHQINWGLSGLAALNADAAKRSRYLITSDNEDEL